MNDITPLLGKIHNTDCLTFMRELPDKCVDLVITSPPYNFDAGSGLGNKYNGQNDCNKNYQDLINSCVYESMRIGRLVFFNIQFIAGNKIQLMRLMGKFAEQVKEIIIWDKQTSEPAINENVLNSEFEFILVFSSQEPNRKFEICNFQKGTLANIFRIGKNVNREINAHSALFPTKLPQRIMINFLKKGGIVFDPFMGGGTVGKVAESMGIEWFGTEINKEYCEIANKRIEAERNQLKLW